MKRAWSICIRRRGGCPLKVFAPCGQTRSQYHVGDTISATQNPRSSPYYNYAIYESDTSTPIGASRASSDIILMPRSIYTNQLLNKKRLVSTMHLLCL